MGVRCALHARNERVSRAAGPPKPSQAAHACTGTSALLQGHWQALRLGLPFKQLLLVVCGILERTVSTRQHAVQARKQPTWAGRVPARCRRCKELAQPTVSTLRRTTLRSLLDQAASPCRPGSPVLSLSPRGTPLSLVARLTGDMPIAIPVSHGSAHRDLSLALPCGDLSSCNCKRCHACASPAACAPHVGAEGAFTRRLAKHSGLA